MNKYIKFIIFAFDPRLYSKPAPLHIETKKNWYTGICVFNCSFNFSHYRIFCMEFRDEQNATQSRIL